MKFIHDEINDLCRKARRIAPVAANEAMDTGCTNYRPTTPGRARAWDLIQEAYRLNSISEDEAACNAEGFTTKIESRRPVNG